MIYCKSPSFPSKAFLGHRALSLRPRKRPTAGRNCYTLLSASLSLNGKLTSSHLRHASIVYAAPRLPKVSDTASCYRRQKSLSGRGVGGNFTWGRRVSLSISFFQMQYQRYKFGVGHGLNAVSSTQSQGSKYRCLSSLACLLPLHFICQLYFPHACLLRRSPYWERDRWTILREMGISSVRVARYRILSICTYRMPPAVVWSKWNTVNRLQTHWTTAAFYGTSA